MLKTSQICYTYSGQKREVILNQISQKYAKINIYKLRNISVMLRTIYAARTVCVCVCVCNGRVYVRPSVPSTAAAFRSRSAAGARAHQQLCRSPGAGGRYPSISAAGARAAAAGSVVLTAEVRGSTEQARRQGMRWVRTHYAPPNK